MALREWGYLYIIISSSISSTLLLGVQGQDPQAWERLYRVWGPVVYHHLRSKGIPSHDAEDLVQIVFMKISQGIGQFQRGRFRAWLYQIIKNCIVDYFRSKNRIPIARGGLESGFSSVPAPEHAPPVSGDEETPSTPVWVASPEACNLTEGASPEESGVAEVGSLTSPHPIDSVWQEDFEGGSTEKKLLVRQILEVIQTDFEDRTFRAFWRTAVDGLSSAEVGEELGMSAEAVRAARYRVLRRLRQELEEMGYNSRSL